MASKKYLAQRAAYFDAEFLRVLKETSDLHKGLQVKQDEINLLESVRVRKSSGQKSVQLV